MCGRLCLYIFIYIQNAGQNKIHKFDDDKNEREKYHAFNNNKFRFLYLSTISIHITTPTSSKHYQRFLSASYRMIAI